MTEQTEMPFGLCTGAPSPGNHVLGASLDLQRKGVLLGRGKLYPPTVILAIIWYSITHSLFHSRLKTFLFCKSFPPQLLIFLLQDSLYGFPRLFTVTSAHIRLYFYFFLFYTF